jgi:hypothetical protein
VFAKAWVLESSVKISTIAPLARRSILARAVNILKHQGYVFRWKTTYPKRRCLGLSRKCPLLCATMNDSNSKTSTCHAYLGALAA